jgi:hypothetical protein
MAQRVENIDEPDWQLIIFDFGNKDDPNIKKALQTLRKSQHRISASGRGIHVRGWAYCNDTLKVREKLGDDPIRIKLDRRIMERPQGTLRDVKIVNGKRMKAGNWVDFII